MHYAKSPPKSRILLCQLWRGKKMDHFYNFSVSGFFISIQIYLFRFFRKLFSFENRKRNPLEETIYGSMNGCQGKKGIRAKENTWTTCLSGSWRRQSGINGNVIATLRAWSGREGGFFTKETPRRRKGKEKWKKKASGHMALCKRHRRKLSAIQLVSC